VPGRAFISRFGFDSQYNIIIYHRANFLPCEMSAFVIIVIIMIIKILNNNNNIRSSRHRRRRRRRGLSSGACSNGAHTALHTCALIITHTHISGMCT